MALLFTEGFDSYPNPIPLWYKWNVQTTATRVAGRTGFGMQPAHFGFVTKSFQYSTGLVFGFAIKPTNTGDLNYLVARIYNKSDQYCFSIGLTNYNTVYVADFNDTNIDVTTFSIPLNQWSYLEAKVTNLTNAAPAGSLQLRGTVGSNTFNFYSSPGTRVFNNATDNQASSLVFFARGDQSYDDVYICDLLGGVNNTFLGAVKVRTVFPTANGFITQLTPVGAGSNYQAVNNSSLSPDTTYVESRVIGDKDLYLGGGLVLAPGNTVKGLTVNAVVRKDKSGYGHVKLPVRVAATDSNGTDSYIPVGYQTFQRPLDVNPVSGLPWQENDVNNLQTGVMIS